MNISGLDQDVEERTMALSTTIPWKRFGALLGAEFQPPKLSPQLDLWHRTASHWALLQIFSYYYYYYYFYYFTLGTPFPREPKNWLSNTKVGTIVSPFIIIFMIFIIINNN